jgi:nucleotide-binding universal stress UspA family protein
MIGPATILVPLDGSTNATDVLSVARGLAHLKGATVVLIHVGREASAPDEFLGRMRLSAEDVRGLVIDQCTGALADTIVLQATARHSVLIVMSGDALPDGPLPALGSVIEDVLATAPCPVVLVPSIRGRYPWALRQLVVPLDGTPTSAAAIAPAADLASRAGAEHVVLHVATPSAERPTESGTFVVPRYLDQPQHEWPAWSLFAWRGSLEPEHGSWWEVIRVTCPCPDVFRVQA